MLNILIIGGSGYVGSCLHEHLCSKYNVDTVDLEWFGKFNDDNSKMDYADLTQCDIDKYNVIILLAGHSSVQMCQGRMLDCMRNNVSNFTGLVEKIAQVRHRIKFIYASSSSILSCLDKPKNGYDLTKLMIDQIIQLYPIEYYSLRFGTVNGKAPHVREELMINAMVSSAINKGYITTSNPNISRPVLGTDDLCRAIESIILEEGNKRGIYNVASFNSSVFHIAKEVADFMKVEVKMIDSLSSPYDFIADTYLFEKAFNFTFKDSIESIVHSLVHHYPFITFTHRKDDKEYN